MKTVNHPQRFSKYSRQYNDSVACSVRRRNVVL